MIYTVVLNSEFYYSTEVAANDRSSRYYAIDWSFLPEDKKYKVSFSFKSMELGAATFTADTLTQLHVNLSASTNTYKATDKVVQNVSNFIGLLQIENVSDVTDQRLYATTIDNTPITIKNRPNNNIFKVEMFDNQNRGILLYADYILVLSFEELNE